MSNFTVNGRVATISFKTEGNDVFNGSITLPEFRVTASTAERARELAAKIVDPLNMAPASELTVTEDLSQHYTVTLGELLDEATEALNGDSNDLEHDALYSVAESIAGLLGVRLDELLED